MKGKENTGSYLPNYTSAILKARNVKKALELVNSYLGDKYDITIKRHKLDIKIKLG